MLVIKCDNCLFKWNIQCIQCMWIFNTIQTWSMMLSFSLKYNIKRSNHRRALCNFQIDKINYHFYVNHGKLQNTYETFFLNVKFTNISKLRLNMWDNFVSESRLLETGLLSFDIWLSISDNNVKIIDSTTQIYWFWYFFKK